MSAINIDETLAQAKAYENTDDYEKAVILYDKAFEHFKEVKDKDNAIYCIGKNIRILKRESEFYRAANRERAFGDFYIALSDFLNAARHFSRAGAAYVSVSAFSEAAGAYGRAGDMFFELKGEFYVEAAKHYKLSTICFINAKGRQSVDYRRVFDKALNAYERAREIRFINPKEYLLYLANFYADVQEALSRNGFYREERELYIKKMDYIRLGNKIAKGEKWKYISMSIWKYTCLYGESSFLWMGWIFVHMMLFSMLYHYMKLVTLNGIPLSFAESIFFAVNVFATLGFGSYEIVSDTARLVVGLDVLSGYFMMAMLITVFTRKLTR